MAESIGQIGLDLVLNKGDFDKQLKNIQGMAKKAAKALAAAFSIKKLVDFGKECIELGSDLEEVQNVVDVTFPAMSKQVDEFAKNAASSFGLSETMAKKFTGTFGSMAKAFGFSEQQAYDMSTTLTGLAGDVASFYNLSQDEAYTKLKSVFTGETESLKDLGVVMSQTALDSYALANGFGKTTANMSEMEKVALRYQFVQNQLSTAAGDFSRTSDGWANQVRILELQFDSLKATLGQGLINVLTPVVKVINTIIGKLMSLANAFKSFTELVAGKKSGGETTAAGMDAVTDSAGQAKTAVSGVGSAAKKAAKDIKGATTGIDEFNIISPTDSSSGSSAGAAGDYSVDTFNMGEVDTSVLDEVDSKYQKLIKRLQELSGLVKKGFWDGLGDTTVFQSVQTSIEGIRDSLKNIFTTPDLLNSASQFADGVAYNFGRVAGAVGSIGGTIADNLLGGISSYLEQNGTRIKDYLVSMFDIGSSISSIAGNLSSAVAEIFSVFRSDNAKQITADIIQIFSDAVMGITELLGKFGRDVLNIIAKPIIDNKDEIKKAIEELLDKIQPIISGIADLLAGMFDGLNEAYDQYAKPVFDALAQALSDVVAWCLDNTETIEAITVVVAAFFAAWDTVKLGEFIINAGGVTNAFKNMIGPITSATAALLSNAKAFITNTAAKLADKIETAAIVALYAKDFVVAVASSIAALVKQAAQFAINTALKLADAVAQATMTAATVAWNVVCTIATTLTTALGAAIAFLTSPIGIAIAAIAALIAIGVLLYTHWDEIKAKATEVWDSIKTAISVAWEKVKAVTSAVWEAIKYALSSLWNEIKTTAANAFDNLKESIFSVWNAVKEKTSSIWEGIWTSIKNVINSILGGIESMVNAVASGINKLINGLNTVIGLGSDVTELLFGKSIPRIPTFQTVSLPRLAEGGFVRANTPQLAMIGDNRRYGEIVAPEDKMQEMVNRAVTLAAGAGGMNDQYLSIMIDLLKRIIELIESLDLTVNIDIREIKKKLVDLEGRTGYTLRTT